MNGFTPDRKPQQMARMLAMQERNLSLNSPGNNMRNVPQPNLMYQMILKYLLSLKFQMILLYR